jgi:hypothetical protein
MSSKNARLIVIAQSVEEADLSEVAETAEIAESVEGPEPVPEDQSLKKTNPSKKAAKRPHPSRTTSKPVAKKTEAKASLPGTAKISKVQRDQKRKTAGRKGPKVETAAIATTTTRGGRVVKKPVRYGLDQ